MDITDIDEVENIYLDARYPCTALLVKTRSFCRNAWLLDDALRELCNELRSILRRAGRDSVSRKFDPSLLEKSVEELLSTCKAAVAGLERLGSRVAPLLARALAAIEECVGARAPP